MDSELENLLLDGPAPGMGYAESGLRVGRGWVAGMRLGAPENVWTDGEGKQRPTSSLVREILRGESWADHLQVWQVWEAPAGGNIGNLVYTGAFCGEDVWQITREEAAQLQYHHAAAGRGELPILPDGEKATRRADFRRALEQRDAALEAADPGGLMAVYAGMVAAEEAEFPLGV